MLRKKMKDVWPVLQAWAEGKTIQYKDDRGWHDITGILDCNHLECYNFRIKPEPKYRPFKDAEECWQEMQKHQPFGWVKAEDEDDKIFSQITSINNESGKYTIGANRGWRSEKIFELYTFADGEPFGVKEEE